MLGQECELPPGPREPGEVRGAVRDGAVLCDVVLEVEGAVVAVDVELAALATAAPPPARAPVAASVASSGVIRMSFTSFG